MFFYLHNEKTDTNTHHFVQSHLRHEHLSTDLAKQQAVKKTKQI